MSQYRDVLGVSIVVALLLLLIRSFVQPNPEVRNFEFMPEMVYSDARESYAASGVLPGGRVLQGLVAGTVPRGAPIETFGAGEEEALRAGRELESPLGAGEPVDLARGRALYGIYCSLCHDDQGEGQGSVVARGLLPPPSLHAARAMAMPDGQLFHVLTHGQGNMAAYAAQLAPRERWQVILHLRSLQEGSR